MTPFNATVYGPNLPDAGITVVANFSNGRLYAGPHVDIDTAELSASAGGFEHDQLFLDWQDGLGNAWALRPISKADAALAYACAPMALRQQMSVWQGRKRRIKAVWGTLGGLTVACVLAAVLLWWQYDRAVSWVADHVPVAKEESLGNSVLEQIKAEGDVIDKGAAVQAIKDIGQRLTAGSRYKYQWLLKKDKEVNAFALPGGIVVVHTALLQKVGSAEELAAVLAHEVQHIEQRHALKNMIHSFGWAALLMAVLGDVNAATAVIIHQAGQMYFSRDIEDEADRLGYAALLRAKIKPDGMVTFFEKLKSLPGGGVPEWISSHPATAERIATIKNLLKTQACQDCIVLPINWKTVQQDPALRKT